MAEYRTERDSMGEMQVPADALYAAQTQRAVENFPISGIRFPRVFLRSLALGKGRGRGGEPGAGPAGRAAVAGHPAGGARGGGRPVG